MNLSRIRKSLSEIYLPRAATAFMLTLLYWGLQLVRLEAINDTENAEPENAQGQLFSFVETFLGVYVPNESASILWALLGPYFFFSILGVIASLLTAPKLVKWTNWFISLVKPLIVSSFTFLAGFFWNFVRAVLSNLGKTIRLIGDDLLSNGAYLSGYLLATAFVAVLVLQGEKKQYGFALFAIFGFQILLYAIAIGFREFLHLDSEKR